MSDKMKLISAIGLAAMAGMAIGDNNIPRNYEPAEETEQHKEHRAKRRNKRRIQKASRKANKP